MKGSDSYDIHRQHTNGCSALPINDGACGEHHPCRQNYDDSFKTHGTPQKTREEMNGDRSEWAVASAMASIVSASIDAESTYVTSKA